MKVRFAPRALAEAKRKKKWWLKNRPGSPDLFEDELGETLDRIAKTPELGIEYPSHFDVVVRRLLMPRTRNHIYFTVGGDEVVVLSVWGAQRRSGPKL